MPPKQDKFTNLSRKNSVAIISVRRARVKGFPCFARFTILC